MNIQLNTKKYFFICMISTLILCVQTARGETIQSIAPNQVETLVEASKGGKPLVIHYTSDDGSCSPCVDNIEPFTNAARSLSRSYDFATVILNPWKRYFEAPEGKVLIEYQKALRFPLAAVPAIMVFANGEPVRMLMGKEKDLIATLSKTHETVTQQKAIIGGDVSVTNVALPQIKTYVTAFSQERPLFLTFSSTDESCKFCAPGNQAVDEASRYVGKDYNFARVDLSPWKTAIKNKDLTKFLSGFDIKLKGLPTSLIFYKGKLMGSVKTNGRDLSTVLSQALSAITKQD